MGITMAQKAVTGKVTDGEGESLIGVSILVKGTGTGTVTDLDGSFKLSVPEAMVRCKIKPFAAHDS